MEGIEENILDKLPMPHLSQIRFPLKLWKLLNNCESGAITWSIDGDSFIINRRIFQTEFLGRKSNTFKTQNINSLVRQLNLYGFQKVQRRPFAGISRKHWPDLLEYRHNNFRRGFPELVNLVQRRSKEEEEGHIASKNLAQYETTEEGSSVETKLLQNQSQTCTGTAVEEMGLCEVQSRQNRSQDSSQPKKLPLQPLRKIRPVNNLQNLPLQGQDGVIRVPIILSQNPLQTITLPVKIHATRENAPLVCASTDNLPTTTINIPQIGGNEFVQENYLNPLTMPITVQVLKNGIQTVQADSLLEPGIHNFQGQTIQTVQMEHVHLPEQAAQILQANDLVEASSQNTITCIQNHSNENVVQRKEVQTLRPKEKDHSTCYNQTLPGFLAECRTTSTTSVPDL